MESLASDISVSLPTSGRPKRANSPWKWAKGHPCLTAKGMMNTYRGCLSHSNGSHFGNTDVSLPKHLEVLGVANAPQGTVHSEDKHLSYPFTAQASITYSSVNAVNYKLAPDRLEEMPKHKAAKKTDKEIFKKNWHEDVQVPGQSEQHRLASLKKLTEFMSI